MEAIPAIQPLPDSGLVVMKIPYSYTRAMREELANAVKQAKERSGSEVTILILPEDIELGRLSDDHLRAAGLQRIPVEG